MDNEDLQQATEDFITRRVNWHSLHEPDATKNAYMDLHTSALRLIEALHDEQRLLFRDVDNNYRIMEGELTRAYYESGFSDAIRFILQYIDEDGN